MLVRLYVLCMFYLTNYWNFYKRILELDRFVALESFYRQIPNWSLARLYHDATNTDFGSKVQLFFFTVLFDTRTNTVGGLNSTASCFVVPASTVSGSTYLRC